jgi:hypothetical protein
VYRPWSLLFIPKKIAQIFIVIKVIKNTKLADLKLIKFALIDSTIRNIKPIPRIKLKI